MAAVRLNTASKSLLVALVQAGAVMGENGQPNAVGWSDPKIAETLRTLDKPLVTVNPNVADPEGKGRVATVLTGEGLSRAEKLANPTKREAAPMPEFDPNSFTIDDAIPVPQPKRGKGAAPSPFPFDKLNNGQSFFIPATAEIPDPWKRFAGTVSTQNRKHKNDNVRFVMREASRDVNGTTQKGARVWRQDATPAAKAA